MQSRFSRITFRIALTVCVAVAAGCVRDEKSTPAPAPEPFEVLSEPAQLALVAGSVGSLAAQVNDSSGQPIGGASVRFETFDPKLLRVSDSGEVTSLGPAGRGGIRISSGVRDITVPVIVHPGPAHRVEIVSHMQSMTAGQAAESPVIVRALDAYSNPVAQAEFNFEFGGEPPNKLTAVSDANGTAAVSLPAFKRAGPATLRVSTSGEAPVEMMQDFMVTPAAAAAFDRVEFPADGKAAPDDELDIALRVVDEYGNPVPAVLVRWTTGTRSGLAEPREAESGPDGIVRTHWSLKGVSARKASLRAVSADSESVALVLDISVGAARAKQPGTN